MLVVARACCNISYREKLFLIVSFMKQESNTAVARIIEADGVFPGGECKCNIELIFTLRNCKILSPQEVICLECPLQAPLIFVDHYLVFVHRVDQDNTEDENRAQ